MTQVGFTIAGTSHPICPVMLGDARLASVMADDMLKLGEALPPIPLAENKRGRNFETLASLHGSSLHRHLCDRILLPSRTQGQSQDPSPDLSSTHRRRHWPVCGRFYPNREKARRHLLSGKNWPETGETQPSALALRTTLPDTANLWLMVIGILVTFVGQWSWKFFSCVCLSDKRHQDKEDLISSPALSS